MTPDYELDTDRTFLLAETERQELSKISKLHNKLQFYILLHVGRLTLVPHLASYYYLLQTKPLGKQASTIESKIMQLKILSSLIIAVVGTSGAASRAFIPKKNVAVNKALSVRGGAGPLPAEATAKAAIAILGVQGLYEFLAPEKNVEAYDISGGDEITTFIAGQDGACNLAPAISSYAILCHDMPPMKVRYMQSFPLLSVLAVAILKSFYL